jgi:hypothetical protein
MRKQEALFNLHVVECIWHWEWQGCESDSVGCLNRRIGAVSPIPSIAAAPTKITYRSRVNIKDIVFFEAGMLDPLYLSYQSVRNLVHHLINIVSKFKIEYLSYYICTESYDVRIQRI